MKKKILASLFAAAALFTSCDDLADRNINPNEPTEVPAEFLLTQAQYGLAENYWGRTLNFGFGMLMVQHFAETEYTDASRYNFDNNDFDGAFTGFYSSSDGSLSEIAAARTIIEANPNLSDAQRANQLAVLDILKAWSYQIAVDIWGNIPYSEAHKPDEFTTPSYDDAQGIYTSLVDLLTQASDNISTGDTGFTSGDVIYGGDMAMWKKFANSLKVKVAMRMADANSSAASAAVSSAMAAGVFESSDDNALFVFASDAQLANPFWVDNVTNNRDDFAISSVLVDYMAGNDDPRLANYANPANDDGDIIGLTYGLIDNDATSAQVGKSRPNTTYVRSATNAARLMTYSELKFFQTEAIDRGFVSGDASATFEAAIRASMAEWNITDATAIDAYVAARPLSSFGSVKQAVGMEKWVSLYTNGLEAWSEWRRLDFPQLELPDVDPGALFFQSIPVRGLYPNSEFIRNTANVEAAGTNALSTKLFWDMD